MPKMRPEQKALLEPYADQFGLMADKLFNMTDEELDALSDAVEATDTGNCWCMMYDAARWLREEIKGQRIDRKARAVPISNGKQGDAT